MVDQVIGAGVGTITWSEIVAYQQATGIKLDGWECEMAVRLSNEYMAALKVFNGVDHPPPYQTQDRQQIVLQAMREHLRESKVSGRRSRVTNKGR